MEIKRNVNLRSSKAGSEIRSFTTFSEVAIRMLIALSERCEDVTAIERQLISPLYPPGVLPRVEVVLFFCKAW